LSHRTDTRSDGTEKKKKKKREREGNGERDGGVRIREIIENEDSWGKVIIPFKQGPIKRIILVPAGYTDGELVHKYSYMGLALKKEWFFMIFDFMDKIRKTHWGRGICNEGLYNTHTFKCQKYEGETFYSFFATGFSKWMVCRSGRCRGGRAILF
jgi:hypothetical protein